MTEQLFNSRLPEHEQETESFDDTREMDSDGKDLFGDYDTSQLDYVTQAAMHGTGYQEIYSGDGAIAFEASYENLLDPRDDSE